MAAAPQTGRSETAMVLHREQPRVEPLLRGVGGIGELVESVAEDEASLHADIAALRAHIIDRFAALSGPTPSPVDNRSGGGAVAALHDLRGIGDADFLARLHVRCALGHIDLDLEVVEVFGDRRDVYLEPIIIAHARRSPRPCDSTSFPLCSTYGYRPNPFRSRRPEPRRAGPRPAQPRPN